MAVAVFTSPFRSFVPYAQSGATAAKKIISKTSSSLLYGAERTISVFDTIKADPDALSKGLAIVVRVISIAGEFTNVGRLNKLVDSFHNGMDVLENAQIGETFTYFLKGKFLVWKKDDKLSIDYQKSIAQENLEKVITKVGFSVAAIGGLAQWLDSLKVIELAKHSISSFGRIGLTQVIQGGLVVGFVGTAKEALSERNAIKFAWCSMELGLIAVQIAGFSVNPLAMSVAVIATKSAGLACFLSTKWPKA